MMSYDSVTLEPRVKSSVPHRSQCDTSVKLSDLITLDVPIIASPMSDICNGEMALTLAQHGALGIIHRYQEIDEQVRQMSLVFDSFLNDSRPNVPQVACAIGVGDDFAERASALYLRGCRIYCIDTANGFHDQVEPVVKFLREFPEFVYIIAGNIATEEGYRYLVNLGVDAVRVGIAGGSVCTTRQETGVYMPTLESVAECASVRRRHCMVKTPAIIADGGIRKPEDMAKALAIGADAVMGGRIFAGYRETPGEVVKQRHVDSAGREYFTYHKFYRGQASYGVQKEFTGEKPDYNEGAEELVPFVDKSASIVLARFKNGFRSTMSMMNSTTLEDYRKNVTVDYL